MLYPIILTLHNLTRWAVVVLGVYVLYRAYSGLAGRREWASADANASRWFAVALSLQFVLGIIFFLLPGSVANTMLGDMSLMRDRNFRFFSVEHSVVMFVAVALSHAANGAIRNAPNSAARFRRLAIVETLAMVLILLAIPWPFLSYGRPWFRLG